MEVSNPVIIDTVVLLFMLLFLALRMLQVFYSAERDKNSGGCNHVAAMSMHVVIIVQHTNQNMSRLNLKSQLRMHNLSVLLICLIYFPVISTTHMREIWGFCFF